MTQDPTQQQRAALVVISGVDIRFWDLVKLQVKFALAAIPAMIILFVFGAIIIGAIRGGR